MNNDMYSQNTTHHQPATHHCIPTTTQPTMINWNILLISPIPNCGKWLVTHESHDCQAIRYFPPSGLHDPPISDWSLPYIQDDGLLYRETYEFLSMCRFFSDFFCIFFCHDSFVDRPDDLYEPHNSPFLAQTADYEFSTYVSSETHAKNRWPTYWVQQPGSLLTSSSSFSRPQENRRKDRAMGSLLNSTLDSFIQETIPNRSQHLPTLYCWRE